MAATAEINTPERPGSTTSYPVAASTKIFAGTLVAINSSGDAVPAANTSGLKVVGRAEETVDNSSGDAGDLNISVKRGVFRFDNSDSAAVDADDKGKVAYVEDDMTVAETASESIAAGVVLAVDSDGVWIDTAILPVQVGSIGAGAVGTTELAAAAVTTAKLADAGITPAKLAGAAAVTATADGATTGIIPATAFHATVTSADAAHIVTLPAPVVGKQVIIDNGATAFELQTSDPETIGINGGTPAAGASSTVAANETVIAICISATAWKAIKLDADSDVAKLAASAA
jgi:hypothetical protein